MEKELTIAILLYDRVTALDAIGPYEILSRLHHAKVCFVADAKGPKRTDTGMLALHADYALDEVPRPDVLVVPGGPAAAVPRDEKILDWVRAAHASSQWTASVCTGALVLGAAGLLRGLRATTHWGTAKELSAYGAEYVSERYVRNGRIITAAGVSAGIDMALFLAAQIAGEDVAKMIQLYVEYEPDPPFRSGSPTTASRETLAGLARYFKRP